MGSHSPEHMKRKRRKRKAKQRCYKKKPITTQVIDSDKSTYDESSSSEDDFYRRCEKRFWETAKEQAQELTAKDNHPAIISDPETSVVLFVADNKQDFSELDQQQFVSNIQYKKQRALSMVNMYRNRVEELERQVEGTKLEVERAIMEGNIKANEIRKFWRNKVYEGGTRSVRMVMEVIIVIIMSYIIIIT